MRSPRSAGRPADFQSPWSFKRSTSEICEAPLKPVQLHARYLHFGEHTHTNTNTKAHTHTHAYKKRTQTTQTTRTTRTHKQHKDTNKSNLSFQLEPLTRMQEPTPGFVPQPAAGSAGARGRPRRSSSRTVRPRGHGTIRVALIFLCGCGSKTG